jgi:hypothetical protein
MKFGCKQVLKWSIIQCMYSGFLLPRGLFKIGYIAVIFGKFINLQFLTSNKKTAGVGRVSACAA